MSVYECTTTLELADLITEIILVWAGLTTVVWKVVAKEVNKRNQSDREWLWEELLIIVFSLQKEDSYFGYTVSVICLGSFRYLVEKFSVFSVDW